MSDTSTPPTIRRIEVAQLTLPMERETHLDGRPLLSREYVAMRAFTSDGLVGAALGYTRGTPLLGELCDAARSLIRNVPSDNTELTPVHLPAASVRARSIIEIAMWDIAALRADLPLSRLLGGERESVPMLAVGGYADDGSDHPLRLAELGFQHLKTHFFVPDFERETQRLRTIRDELGGSASLAIDVHRGWTTVHDAIAMCEVLEELELSFIEDPFPPGDAHKSRELAHAIRTPIAAGEDVPDLAGFRELARGVDIVRVDATSCGGVQAFIDAAEAASENAKPVVTHAFHELHAQIAGAIGVVDLVELIPYRISANPLTLVLARTQEIRDGRIILAAEPGNGLRLDWDAVARHSTFTQIIE